MCGSKSIVDVDIGERCELFGELRIVALFPGVEAHVLQQQNVAVVQRIDRPPRDLAHAIGGKGDGKAEALRKRAGNRPQRVLRIGLSVGTAEMGADDRARAAIVQPAQRRKRGIDARIIDDLHDSEPSSCRRTGTFKSSRTKTRLPRTSSSVNFR